MDIRKWLDETEDTESPPNPASRSGANFFLPVEKPKPVFADKRAPKRTKSDSSLLDPRPPPPKKYKAASEGSADASAYSEASHPDRDLSTLSEASSQRYARKPRRKTRPERYEPSSRPDKKRGKLVYTSRRDKSKKTGRKSRRKKDEKPHIGQTFQAKNVSRDRLTLKPREPLGIFNKGKASTAVKGRGLPDLVFSEMKFLQQDKERSESAPPENAPKKKRKRDHTQTKEGEISAFFNSVRPALIEKDDDALIDHGEGGVNSASWTTRREQEQVIKPNAIIPTTETPDKGSYLGFGSRGPRHESGSYASWSESVRAPSITPRQAQCQLPVPKSQNKSTKCFTDANKIQEDKTVFKRPAPPSASRKKTDATAERFAVSSMSSSQQRLSRSHSYPQHTSSPRRVNLVDRAAKFQMTDPVASPSSLPPVMPALTSVDCNRVKPAANSKRASPHSYTTNASMSRQATSNDEERVLDAEAHTSSDLGRVLQQCNDTFNERRQATAPRRRHTELPDSSRANDGLERQSHRSTYPRSQEVRTVHFSGVASRSPRLPSFYGPSIYEQQAQRHHIPMPRAAENDFMYEDECLAAQNYAGEKGERISHEHMEEQFADEPDLYVADLEDEKWDTGEWYTPEDTVQHIESDNSVVAPGFWRPNKLY